MNRFPNHNPTRQRGTAVSVAGRGRAYLASSLADASGYEKAPRRGFTLIELLIAIGIFLILTAIAVSAVNAFGDGDRVSGSARQVQSFIAGARDRAIFTNQSDAGPRPVGVRLLVDRNLTDAAGNPFACTTLQYVQGGGFFPQALPDGRRRPLPGNRNLFLNAVTARLDGTDHAPGTVLVPNVISNDPSVRAIVTAEADIPDAFKNQQLNQLFRAGVLGEPVGGNEFLTRVRLSPPGTWRQAVIVSEDPADDTERGRRAAGIRHIVLLGAATGGGGFNSSAALGTARTQFELRAVPLAGEQPRALPADTAIDLLGTARLGGLPDAWFTPGRAAGSPVRLNQTVPFVVMFDPAGTVTGSLSAAGADPPAGRQLRGPGRGRQRRRLPARVVHPGRVGRRRDGRGEVRRRPVRRPRQGRGRVGRHRQHADRQRDGRPGGPLRPVRRRRRPRGRRAGGRPVLLRGDRRGGDPMTARPTPRRPTPIAVPAYRGTAPELPLAPAVIRNAPRHAADRPGARRGVTLTEVLMSLLVMGIGVVSVATLFPLAVLRGAKATQYTAGTVLKQNAEETLNVSASPSLAPGAFPSFIGGIPTDFNADKDYDDQYDTRPIAGRNPNTGALISPGVTAGAMVLDPDANGSRELFGPPSLIAADGQSDWNADGVGDSFRKFVVDPLGAAVLAGLPGDGVSPIVMGSLNAEDISDPDTRLIDQFGVPLRGSGPGAPVWRFAWPFPREMIAAAEDGGTFTRNTAGGTDTVSARDQMIEAAYALVGREGDYGVGADTVATITRTAGPAGSDDFLTVTFGDDVDPGSLEDFFPQDAAGPPPVGTGLGRAVVFSPGEGESTAIPLRLLYDARAVNVIETVGGAETVRLALPRNQFLGLTGMGGAGDAGLLRVRLERPDRRYSWMLTCQGGGNDALRTQVAVFFNRPLGADDEQIWLSVRASTQADGTPYGSDLFVYRLYYSDNEADDVPAPLVDGGTYLLEMGELSWQRVGEVIVEPTAVVAGDPVLAALTAKLPIPPEKAPEKYIDFTLEGGGLALNEAGGGDVLYATFPRGVVDVFPLADRYTFQKGE